MFGVGGADLGLSAVTYSLGHSQQLSAPRNQPELGASQLALLRLEFGRCRCLATVFGIGGADLGLSASTLLGARSAVECPQKPIELSA